MNSTLKALMVIVLVAGAMMISGTVASADEVSDEGVQQYRDAMWYFVPELGKWAGELEDAVAVVGLKPETADALVEIAYRGTYMVYDLEGTTPPEELVDAHEDLLFSLRQMTEAAQIAADDTAGAELLIDNETDRFNAARREIRGWMLANVTIIEIGQAPVVPVTGN